VQEAEQRVDHAPVPLEPLGAQDSDELDAQVLRLGGVGDQPR
jgi:hypothetical protein